MPATAAATSRPPKTRPIEICRMRLRVRRRAASRSHSSGTKMKRPTDATSSPASSTSMRGSPCGSGGIVVSDEGERPVRPRLQLRGSRRDLPTWPARRRGAQQSQLLRRPAATARARRLVQRRARPRLRAAVCSIAHVPAPAVVTKTLPLLRAIRDVAFERRDADAPARLRAGTRRAAPAARASPAVSDTNSCGPPLPSSGTGIRATRASSVTPRAASSRARAASASARA